MLARQRVEPFTDRQIELVSTFADQAVIAIENTRLITEQREALEQQTATAEVLQVINASPGNLAPVFDAILDKAHRLCGAVIGSLLVSNGEYFHAAATHGHPQQMALFVRQPFRPNHFLHELLRGERIVHIPDFRAAEADQDHELTRNTIETGVRTSLWVPLRKDGTLLGCISAFRMEVQPFSEREITLLESFAAQAVIAMENARLITEQREALEQQTATAEVLQVINASPGNLVPVFDAMLEKAMRLCEAAFGSLYTYDGERFHSAAQRGVPPAYATFRAENPPLATGGGPPARMVETRGPIQSPDVMASENYRTGNPYARALVDLGGIRAVLNVPLLKEGALLGFIAIYREEAGAFSDKQISLLKNFAAQAVIAMENARLITEQREALEHQTATAEVLQVINASPGNLQPVFEAILERAHSLCDIAQGSLELYDGERFRAVAVRGLSDAFADMLRLGYPASDNPATRPLIEGSRFSHIRDLAQTDYSITRSSVELAGARTLLCIPLRRDDTVLGMIASGRREARPFSEKEIALLENFAAQAVIAMENARLITEQREALEQQTATAEVLQVINASPGNLTPVFDAILERAMRVCDAAFGSLLIYDGESLRAASLCSVPEGFAAFLRKPLVPEPGTALAQVIDERRIVHWNDAMAQDAYLKGAPLAVAGVEGGGVRTLIGIPLAKDGDLLGIFHLYRQEVRPFSDKHIALLQNFAAQAVIAMENARLIDGIRAARDNAEATLRELKAAQANLIQAEKMASLGQLTAGIAHEIKNPLNFVNNFAELSVDLLGELKDAISPAEPALSQNQRDEVDEVVTTLTSNLEKITEHGKRADGIVKAMLEHSRGSSGERRMVDLNALIDEALNLAYHGARAQDQSFNITLEQDFGQGIAPIEVNPQDMTRVFLNIFSNGFYAATKRARNGAVTGFVPTLKVTTRDAGVAVEIRVRDNGTGIPADIRDKLFQPFFSTKPTGEGTGLGLSITYDIVTKQHGGTITVDSEVNEFTEFVVTLPRQMFAGGCSRA